MHKWLPALLLPVMFSFCSGKQRSGEWISLFDGKTLNGWKVGANASAFKVENGCIVVNGNVSHLYYDGEVKAIVVVKMVELNDLVTVIPESRILTPE